MMNLQRCENTVLAKTNIAIKLAAQYQVVVNMFKGNSNRAEKVDLLAKFGGECVEKVSNIICMRMY
jgi:hypothetical protein